MWFDDSRRPSKSTPKSRASISRPPTSHRRKSTSPQRFDDSESEMELSIIDASDASERGAPDVVLPTKSRIKNFFIDLNIYVREFSDTIEFHGLRYLFEEGRAPLERLFWLVVILASLVACIILVRLTSQIYESGDPVVVTMSSKTTGIFDVPFPAVTICSQVKTKYKYKFAEIRRNYEKNKNFSTKDEFKYYQFFFLVCDHPLHQRDTSVFYGDFNDNINDQFFSTLKDLSPKIDEIMHFCRYLSTTYNCSDIFKPIYTELGVCYTFNMVEWDEIYRDTTVQHKGFFEAAKSGSDWFPNNTTMAHDNIESYPRRGFQVGAGNALTVHLKQDTTTLDPVCSTGMSGFKIAVHDPLEVPDFGNYFIHASLNTTFVMTAFPKLFSTTSQVMKLPHRVRKCYKTEEKYLKFFKRYSQTNCINECIANYTELSCGCVPFYMPRVKSTNICGASKLKCYLDAQAKLELMNVESEIEEEELGKKENYCGCKPSCSELMYRVEISDGNIEAPPTSSLEKNLTENINECHIAVFFGERSVTNLEKIELYSFADLMAYIGGVVNFFIGSSILTMVEILYTFTLKIVCNKIIYGPWAGPSAMQYKFDPSY